LVGNLYHSKNQLQTYDLKVLGLLTQAKGVFVPQRYYWLKLQNNFFSDKRMKKLRKIAGGDTYTVIYLKMMLRSLENEGILEFEGVEESFADELALDLDEDSDNVKVTISFLLSAGLMVEIDDRTYELPEVKRNIGSESKWAEKKRNYRLKEKTRTLSSECPSLVTKCPIEIEKEIEKEGDIEEEKEGESERGKTTIQLIVEMFNDTCVSFPKVTAISEKRKKTIRARLNTYNVPQIKEVFCKAQASDFLRGKNNRNWVANFDWIMSDSNFAKILDGNYDNRIQTNNSKTIDNNMNEWRDAYEKAKRRDQQDTDGKDN